MGFKIYGMMKDFRPVVGREALEGLRLEASKRGADLEAGAAAQGVDFKADLSNDKVLYFRAKMLGYDLPNGNGDAIPRVYASDFGPSFIGKHLDLNHETDVQNIIGKVVSTFHVEAPMPGEPGKERVIGLNALADDDSDATRELQLEGICRIDRNTELGELVAQKLLAGTIDGVSQEASTEFAQCSVCGHKIGSPMERVCGHLENGSLMIQSYQVEGRKSKVLAYKEHHNPVGTGLAVVTVPAYDRGRVQQIAQEVKAGKLALTAALLDLKEQAILYKKPAHVMAAIADLEAKPASDALNSALTKLNGHETLAMLERFKAPAEVKAGAKAGEAAGAPCVMCGTPVGDSTYTKSEGPVCSQACAAADIKDAKVKAAKTIEVPVEHLKEDGKEFDDIAKKAKAIQDTAKNLKEDDKKALKEAGEDEKSTEVKAAGAGADALDDAAKAARSAAGEAETAAHEVEEAWVTEGSPKKSAAHRAQAKEFAGRAAADIDKAKADVAKGRREASLDAAFFRQPNPMDSYWAITQAGAVVARVSVAALSGGNVDRQVVIAGKTVGLGRHLTSEAWADSLRAEARRRGAAAVLAELQAAQSAWKSKNDPRHFRCRNFNNCGNEEPDVNVYEFEFRNNPSRRPEYICEECLTPKQRDMLGLDAAKKVRAAYNNTWPREGRVAYYTPEQLGLPPLEVKSEGKTVYRPRFQAQTIDSNGVSPTYGQALDTVDDPIVAFGHYWGGGSYYYSTLLEGRDGRGLDLYGGDTSPDSKVSAAEMDKMRAWLRDNGDALKSALAAKLSGDVKAGIKASDDDDIEELFRGDVVEIRYVPSRSDREMGSTPYNGPATVTGKEQSRYSDDIEYTFSIPNDDGGEDDDVLFTLDDVVRLITPSPKRKTQRSMRVPDLTPMRELGSVDALWSELDKLGINYDPREDYSGRFMYGDVSPFAFVVESVSDAQDRKLTEWGLRRDSMGRGTIYYLEHDPFKKKGKKVKAGAQFQEVTGNEPYKVVDLETGGESFFNEKTDAYKMAWVIKNKLGHNYRIEVRKPEDSGHVEGSLKPSRQALAPILAAMAPKVVVPKAKVKNPAEPTNSAASIPPQGGVSRPK
jgi:endogenous inhibitor of DNA gyrase (YacG/DUF329 family)